MGADGNRHSVPPTLVITAIAHVPDVAHTVTSDFKQPNNLIVLTGATSPEFGASHASMVCLHPIETSGVVPAFDASAPQRYRQLHQAILQGLVVACHDCSEGGVAVAIAEMCIGGRLGAQMIMQSQLDSATDLCTLLFSESLGRHIVEVEPHNLAAFQQLVGQSQIIGTVTDDQSLVLPDDAALSMQTLLGAWQDGQ
jgi:phosphoribosylformylglycinamidine synthase